MEPANEKKAVKAVKATKKTRGYSKMRLRVQKSGGLRGESWISVGRAWRYLKCPVGRRAQWRVLDEERDGPLFLFIPGEAAGLKSSSSLSRAGHGELALISDFRGVFFRASENISDRGTWAVFF